MLPRKSPATSRCPRRLPPAATQISARSSPSTTSGHGRLPSAHRLRRPPSWRPPAGQARLPGRRPELLEPPELQEASVARRPEPRSRALVPPSRAPAPPPELWRLHPELRLPSDAVAVMRLRKKSGQRQAWEKNWVGMPAGNTRRRKRMFAFFCLLCRPERNESDRFAHWRCPKGAIGSSYRDQLDFGRRKWDAWISPLPPNIVGSCPST
jgi:hypothetical protein